MILSWKWLAAQGHLLRKCGVHCRDVFNSKSPWMHCVTYIKAFCFSSLILYTFGYSKNFDVIQIPELRKHHLYCLFIPSLLTTQETYIFFGLCNTQYHTTPAENLKSNLLFAVSTCLLCLDVLDMLYLPAVNMLRSLVPVWNYREDL